MTTSPDSATTTTPDDETLRDVPVPGFKSPRRRPGPDPLPEAMGPEATGSEATTPPASLEGDAPGYSSGPGPGEPTGVASDSSTRTTSSPASTADPDLVLGFVEVARTIVGLASLLVRMVRQRRRPGLPPEAWLADDDDQAAIGDPLARIAARHAPMTGEAAGDTADGLAAMIGGAGYVVKGLQLEAGAPAPAPPAGDVVDVDEGAHPAGASSWSA